MITAKTYLPTIFLYPLALALALITQLYLVFSPASFFGGIVISQDRGHEAGSLETETETETNSSKSNSGFADEGRLINSASQRLSTRRLDQNLTTWTAFRTGRYFGPMPSKILTASSNGFSPTSPSNSRILPLLI